MKSIGRSRATTSAIKTRIVYIYAILALVSAEYGVPIEIKLWDSKRTPINHMVDVTNGFGLKVLAEHNFLNDNNIAFSPYGLMGILVALYEGVDGESSYQIQRSMQLPWNRNVMRIGFRDIHRTLKTYFVPEEGFLAGLALNNENVTFNEAYIKILRFYGFDLEKEQNPPIPPDSNTTTTTLTSVSETVTPMTSFNTVPGSDTPVTASNIGNKEETTVNPNVETVDIRGPKEELSTVAVTQSTIMSTVETPSLDQSSTTPATEQTTPQSISTLEAQLIVETSAAPATGLPTTETPTTSTVQSTMTTAVTQTTTPESTTNANDVSTPTTEVDSTSTTTEIPSTTELTTSMATESPTPTTTSSSPTDSTIETLQRRKRSIVNFVYTEPHYLEDHDAYRSFDVGSVLAEPTLDYDKMFLVNGLRNIEVTYMHYNAILEHAFLPHLEASALKLPLDSDRYYLLVVLPMRRGIGELGRLLARMARESDLSDIYSALRPCRVRAAVPSFVVKGHVTLTTDLQKLGMRDVFEPRQHDFTPMTHQAGVYVRSIEQAVSVAIRKYQQGDTPKGFVSNASPVYFSATYPFLYFVMDANIHVALMAGKMVDPLNTRIL